LQIKPKKRKIYDFLFLFKINQSNGIFQIYSVLFGVLVIPTFLMGLSLPLLSKSFKLHNPTKQAFFISLLYFVNTLGASFGALISGIVLIRIFGLENTVYFGSCLNFICALIAFYIYKKSKKVSNNETIILKPENNSIHFFRLSKYWLFQYTISGFIAIVLEIVWFRILDVAIKSISMTFSILLFVFLFFMAFGTFYGIYYIKKNNKNLLKIFLKAQYILYFYSLAIIIVILFVIANLSYFNYLKEYFFSYETSFDVKILFSLYIFLPILLLAIPTFLMGFCFTISQKIIQREFEYVGRVLGWLQFFNIFGSFLGAWFVSLIGFHYLGTPNILKIIGVIGFIYPIILYRKNLFNNQKAIISVLLLLSTILLIPKEKVFWKILTGVTDSNKILLAEDETAVSSIKLIYSKEISGTIYVNGLGQSALPFDKNSVHISLGSIPSLIHPNPVDIGIIGLGSSGTLYSASGCVETKNIDCFEIIRNQKELLKQTAKKIGYQPVINILNDKRINIIPKDGRFEIQNSSKKYDFIEADALRPRSSFSGNLYSEEYFKIAKTKLKKGGLVATWMPTIRVKNTFTNVFPFVYQIKDFLLIGSNQPLFIDPNKIQIKLNSSFTKNHFSAANIKIDDIIIPLIKNIVCIQNGQVSKNANINTDMFPKDEYMVGDIERYLNKKKE
jgi:spermidine synthase